jgi:RND superfamily putative drug exporter
MLAGSLRVLAHMGSTVAIALLLHTVIVRSLLMPSIAIPLRRLSRWPQVIDPHGDRTLTRIQQRTDATTTNQPVRLAASSHQGAQCH